MQQKTCEEKIMERTWMIISTCWPSIEVLQIMQYWPSEYITKHGEEKRQHQNTHNRFDALVSQLENVHSQNSAINSQHL